MQHVLINTTNENLIFNSVPAGSSVVLYDTVTLDLYAGIGNIINSLDALVLEVDNISYQLYSGAIVYSVGGVLQSSVQFFSWINSFKDKYEYYLQFKSAGFINLKLDGANNNIVIGNRLLNIDDIPNGIPVTKIGSGDITNLEFSTLNNINTAITIQEQLDSKANSDHNHTHTYILSTPSSTWTINHGLGVRPQVELFDAQYNLVLATVDQPDANTVHVKFSKNYTCIANLTI